MKHCPASPRDCPALEGSSNTFHLLVFPPLSPGKFPDSKVLMTYHKAGYFGFSFDPTFDCEVSATRQLSPAALNGILGDFTRWARNLCLIDALTVPR